MAEETVYADRSLVTDEAIDLAMRIARNQVTGKVFHEIARTLTTVRGARSEWRNKLMAEVSKHSRPTLIMWGERDRVLPAKHMDTARRFFPQARAYLFEGVGDMPQLPDQFVQITEEFVRSQIGQGAYGGATLCRPHCSSN